MALTPDQIDDFVTNTLKRFYRHKWTDISLEHQEYHSSTVLNEKNIEERGGEQLSFRLKTKNTGNARNTGLYSQDITKVDDVMQPANVPWSKQTTNFSYDIDEDFFQSDRETIIRTLDTREHDALSDLADLHEQNMWTSPTGPSDTRPQSIPFWIQLDPTTTPGGAFNGGNPAGFSGGCAGVSSVEYPRWRNWTFGYTNVTTDDFVKKFKKALTFTHFRAPVPHPELGFGKTDYCAYTTYRTQEPLERLAESRNDNHGPDVARYMNQVTVGGVPVKWVPYLEANDTSDPVYGVNWRVFRPFVKRGCKQRRMGPERAARQHSVREVHYDTWMNYICFDRRSTFGGSRA